MKVSEVIRNITEIQNPDWVSTLSTDELASIEGNFYWIWLKLNNIKEIEIIEPLKKISEFITSKKQFDGRIRVSFKNMDFDYFYRICIEEIPKKKYTYIYPKKKKSSTPEDYEFVKLLAKDLNESTHNCEEYYHIFEDVGILEKERKRLYTKYGYNYQPITNNKIEMVKINSINPNTAYSTIWNEEDSKLLKDIESYGMLEPILVDKKTNNIINGKRRYRCCQHLGWNKVQVIKRTISPYFTESATTILDRVKEYIKLRDKLKKRGYKERKKIMGDFKMRDYLYNQTGISQSQFHKLEYILRRDQTLFNDIDSGEKNVSKVYSELKGKIK